MIELFEQNIKTNARQSSKGNQLKWENSNIWYKADYTGYEGLTEYVISELLKYSNLKEEEYVKYQPIQIKYKNQIYNACSSDNFLEKGWQIITLERLFHNYFGQSLSKAIWTLPDHKKRLSFLVREVERITRLKNFGQYMNKILTIDALFLNEDRHTHNLAVLMNDNGEFDYCPIFDNGAGLLADTTMDYPMNGEIYNMIDSVQGKTFSTDLEEQLDISEILYGMNIQFSFTTRDVYRILGLEGENPMVSIYPLEVRQRVRKIVCEQMRKYPYLFK